MAPVIGFTGAMLSTGGLNGWVTGDSFGSKTATADTAITRLIQPHPVKLSHAGAWSYKPGATAHTLTFLIPVATTTVTTDAATGQAVLAFAAIPTAPDGSILAAGDWVAVQYPDLSWGEYKVSSVSGLNITMTANFAAVIRANTTIYYFGAPGDHANRQVSLVASVEQSGPASGYSATTPAIGQPILVHADNITAAGTLRFLNYSYTLPD